MVVKKIENGLRFCYRQDELLKDDSYIIEMIEIVLIKLFHEVNERGATRMSMTCTVLNIELGIECLGKDEFAWSFNGDGKYKEHFLSAQFKALEFLELEEVS